MTQTSEVAGPETGRATSTEPNAGPGPVAPSRRDRLRAATIDEIISTARRLLVKDGPEAVSLRAIAREMGMTAPGLYRYFGNYEELVRYLCASIFTELGNDIGQAIEAAEPPATAAGLSGFPATGPDGLSGFPATGPDGLSGFPATGPDGLSGFPATGPDGSVRAKLTVKMVAACREFRRWALNHRGEFALLFGVPLPGLDDGRYDLADECALAFAGTFFRLFLELWQKTPFPVPDDAQIDPGLHDQLSRYRETLGASIPLGAALPIGAVLTFLRCWTLLYGAVAMEVFGHMRFALEDPAPMFEITLGDLAALVGLSYPL